MIAAPVVLGGEDRLLPEPNHAAFVLWAVLGLGVVLLGFMAWQLVRTLDQKKMTAGRHLIRQSTKAAQV